MILKNFAIAVFSFVYLSGCAQNASLLGPAYTLATSGNIYHAGFTYGGNEIVIRTTGKSASQNLKEVLTSQKKDTEFKKLVKKNFYQTRKKLKLSNQ